MEDDGGYLDVIVIDFAFERMRKPIWAMFRTEVETRAREWFGDRMMGVNYCQQSCNAELGVHASTHLHLFVRPSITKDEVWSCVQECARAHVGRLLPAGVPQPKVVRKVLPARRPEVHHPVAQAVHPARRLPEGVVIGNIATGANLTINIARPSRPARPKAPGRRPYGELTRAGSAKASAVILALPKPAIVSVATVAACMAIVAIPASWPGIGLLICILLWMLYGRLPRP